MDIAKLKRIFDFLENQENKIPKDKGSLKWKIIFNEPFTEGELNIEGDLDLYETKITSLPEGLKVSGSLDLAFSEITSLSEGLKVGGNLYIRKTELAKYSDNQLRDMIKPGFIKGKIIRLWIKGR
jgi:hypothetical protein